MPAIKIDKLLGVEQKLNPLTSDFLFLEDTEDKNKLKKVAISSLPSAASSNIIIVDKVTSTGAYNDSTNWKDDSELVIPLEADSTYILEFSLFFENKDSSARAAQMKFVVPTGVSGNGRIYFNNGGSQQGLFNHTGGGGGLSDTLLAPVALNNIGNAIGSFRVTTTLTAGDLILSWKPNQSFANYMNLKAGSYLKATKKV